MYNNKYDILGSTIKPNPASVKYWADLASNPNGGDLKYFNGKDWVYVNNTATSDIKDLRSDLISEISRATGREIDVINNHAELIEGKVDRQPGKGLSTNDYTTEEKNKLAGLTNYNDSEVRELITALTLKVNGLEKRVAALETPAA